MQFPGVTNSWTMPIKARIDMLSTGVRTPIGIKIMGADLEKVQELGEHIEMLLKDVPGTKSVFAERTAGGYFLDFTLKREELARYGLTIDQANSIIMSAIGGENVTTTIEGRERYPVNVRYFRELRDDLEKLRRVFVPVQAGGAASAGGMGGMGGSASSGGRGVTHIPITELAEISLKTGPSMIRDENGRLSGYVYVDLDTSKRDIGSYVADAKKVVRENLKAPAGLPAHLERPVRIHGAGQRTPLRGRADHDLPHLSAPLFQYQVGDQDPHYFLGRSVFSRGGDLVPLSSWIQYEHCSLGGSDRLDGSGCRDRHVHAPLPRSGLP